MIHSFISGEVSGTISIIPFGLDPLYHEMKICK